ncbi:hypothetical protein Tco_0020597 [Tanacetum coccineum]
MPFYKRTALTKRCFNQRFNTGRPFRSTVNTVRARGFNAVKPSACWVWRPIKPNGASLSNSQLNDKGFVDSGCSRHMTGNIAHLLDFKDFDGGYVTFGREVNTARLILVLLDQIWLTKGYTGVEIRLFPTMLTSPTPSSSPSRITSSPSLSSEPSTEPTFEPQPSPDAEIGVLEDDLKRTKKTYSAAFTKLILRIKKLESKVKTGKARKRARVVLSEMMMLLMVVVHDTDEERQPEDSTAGITISTAPINISIARETRSTAGRVIYGRRSKEARKDKGKPIMTEPEPEKKSKKLLEQERLGLEEAIRLQEQVDKEERAQIARR